VGSSPISRVLSWAAIPLGPLLPTASSSLPGSDASHANAPLFGLAPDGVCHAVSVTRNAVGSYPAAACAVAARLAACHHFTLTCTAPAHSRGTFPPSGGKVGTSHRRYLSVALSVTSRCPAVNRHPALRGPDFPPDAAFALASSGCLANFPQALYALDETGACRRNR